MSRAQSSYRSDNVTAWRAGRETGVHPCSRLVANALHGAHEIAPFRSAGCPTKARSRGAVDAGVAPPAPCTLPEDAAISGRVVAHRYLIEAPVERTPQAATYRAEHLVTHRTVLFRILPARAALTHEACHRALALAERAAAAGSPHVARTLDVGVVAERWPFVVSAYSRGCSLAALLAREGPLGVRQTLAIGRQLASALELAHQSLAAHGPLRLAGLWAERSGADFCWVRLLDFGLSELPAPGFTSSASGVFPSASRALSDSGFGRRTVSADVYALGTALWELSTGAPPRLHGGAGELPLASDSPSGARGLERAFAVLVQRCLGVLPYRRYETLSELSAELEALADAAQRWAEPPRGPITALHAPARRAQVVVGEPKVIVRG